MISVRSTNSRSLEPITSRLALTRALHRGIRDVTWRPRARSSTPPPDCPPHNRFHHSRLRTRPPPPVKFERSYVWAGTTTTHRFTPAAPWTNIFVNQHSDIVKAAVRRFWRISFNPIRLCNPFSVEWPLESRAHSPAHMRVRVCTNAWMKCKHEHSRRCTSNNKQNSSPHAQAT